MRSRAQALAHARGLAAARDAVVPYRDLATLYRDIYPPSLAGSVNNLGMRLADAGQRADALTAAQEAATQRG